MSLWTKLHDPPPMQPSNIDIHHGNMHQLSDDELLIVPDTTHEKGSALWKYNIIKNEWIEWISIPTKYYWRYQTSSLDRRSMILYIFGEEGVIFTIDLKTKSFTRSENKYHDGSYCSSQFINNKFHIFFGWNKNTKNHYIWNI